MTEHTHSAIAVAHRNDRVLLLRRRLDDRSYPGTWCFPGGQREESDATPMAAALRELQEETGLKGIVAWPLTSGLAESTSPERTYLIRAFSVLAPADDVVLSDEHIEARWVTLVEGRALDLSGEFTRRILHKLMGTMETV